MKLKFRHTPPISKYNVCLVNGSDQLLRHYHYLSIPLYTSSWSEPLERHTYFIFNLIQYVIISPWRFYFYYYLIIFLLWKPPLYNEQGRKNAALHEYNFSSIKVPESRFWENVMFRRIFEANICMFWSLSLKYFLIKKTKINWPELAKRGGHYFLVSSDC